MTEFHNFYQGIVLIQLVTVVVVNLSKDDNTVSLSVFLSISQPASLSVCLFVCQPVSLSACEFVCLSVSQSVCQSLRQSVSLLAITSVSQLVITSVRQTDRPTVNKSVVHTIFKGHLTVASQSNCGFSYLNLFYCIALLFNKRKDRNIIRRAFCEDSVCKLRQKFQIEQHSSSPLKNK